MNYCILNGVDSRSITGLLIQSMPAISKPLIRTRLEEIDGRDGDIITKLGYSAYDREMLIGLRGNFDVDAVISYFNSEGIAIFSNELGKTYDYLIYNQIDFERLLRYRTATVSFHVQPFKHEANEIELSVPANTDYQVRNKGNIFSRPTITIYGSGTVTLSVNNSQILQINMGTAEYVTINAEEMNAYYGGVLMNRNVIGDYDALRFNVGTNTIRIAGTVTQATVEQYSRWI